MMNEKMSPQPSILEIFRDHDEASDSTRLASNPLVSVFVPAYLHAEYLEGCVESIAAQKTDFPFEILIAEDSSPDATRAVAIALQRKYPHLIRVVFTARNKGGALNTIFGISRARGSLVAYCEGDDFWIDDGKLARQVAALRAHPEVNMAFTRGFRLYPDGKRVLEWDYGEEARIVPLHELFAGHGWTAPTASLVFRTEILRRLPPWFGSATAGDFVIVAGGSVRGGAWYDPTPAICYRIAHATSFTAALAGRSGAERIGFLEDVLRYWKLTCDFYRVPVRHVRHRIDDYRLSLAKLRLRERQPLRALKAFAGISPMFLLRGLGRRLTKRRVG
jgi:glycosyltransferase involved in cell wall biosynthesis